MLFGQLGNDRLDGGDAADHLDGGLGSDNVLGGAGDDQLMGGLGIDSLDGQEGNNLLDNEPETDILLNGVVVDLDREFFLNFTAPGQDRLPSSISKTSTARSLRSSPSRLTASLVRQALTSFWMARPRCRSPSTRAATHPSHIRQSDRHRTAVSPELPATRKQHGRRRFERPRRHGRPKIRDLMRTARQMIPATTFACRSRAGGNPELQPKPSSFPPARE